MKKKNRVRSSNAAAARHTTPGGNRGARVEMRGPAPQVCLLQNVLLRRCFTRKMLFLFSLLYQAIAVEAWNYAASGTDWHTLYPTCGRAFTSQSPINIKTEDVTTGRGLSAIHFSREASGLTQLLMKNSGNALEVTVPEEQGASLSGGSLSPGMKYNLAEIQFHWGSTDSEGSEHWLNGKQSPLEMHVLAWNPNYPTMDLARTATRGIMVVGLLFELGPTNKELQKLLEHIAAVRESGSTTSITGPIDLASMMPTDTAFYSYDGSLTTPPCYQSVRWHVFKTRASVSAGQLAALRTLGIGNNFRPTQPLYHRELQLFSKSTVENEACPADWGFHAFTVTALLCCVIIVVMCIFFREKFKLMEEKYAALRNHELAHLELS